MLRTIFAHHVLAHELGHQPFGLLGREIGDLLFDIEDVVPAGDQGGVELRDKSHWGIASEDFEIGVGINPKRLRIDMVNGRCPHLSPSPAYVLT